MSSDEEQDPIMLDENADALLSLMDGIVDDIPLVEKKIIAVSHEIYGHTVRPRASPMSAVWELLKLPATMDYDALLDTLYLRKIYLRVMHERNYMDCSMRELVYLGGGRVDSTSRNGRRRGSCIVQYRLAT